MMRVPQRKLRLRPSIVALFALFTVPVFLAVIAKTYVSNEAIARANAESLIGRFTVEAINSVQSMFNPIKSLIRSAAMVGAQQPDFYTDNRSLKYMLSLLLHSDKLVSIYVGLDDGSFRQARQINPTVEVQGKLPPPASRYAYRWIDAPQGGSEIDHYAFLDEKHTPIGDSEQSTNYDPRERLWYRQTIKENALVITDPEVFAALGLIGFTIAAPIDVDGKVVGVAAADITLDGLSDFLAERNISPGTLSYILDPQGGVLADSERIKSYTAEDELVALQPITAMPRRVAAVAYSARPYDGDDKPYLVTFEGKNYLASRTTMPMRFGKRWQLFTVTPLSDFAGPFEHNNKMLLIWGLIALLAELSLIYLLAGVVSSPLEKLAAKIADIEDLGTQESPALHSTIAEISVLSKAIDTLGTTIKSFAAFVPVGLVRQLISSQHKLELGGHRQFLTIFFSDLEAFSTLSEEVPTQELMIRVSAYLELVTKAVNEQAGTIDKFMGDGVMAFWGAPSLLEDHAWRACVAALRIARGMDALNERWQAQDLAPLHLRIGIHSDAVLVGNMGSSERMGYTVIGDGVNIASRLEGVNKEYGTRICISHSVYREAGERLCVRPVDDVVIRGRRGTVEGYELLGAYGADPELEPDAATIRLCRLSRLARQAVLAGDVALALGRYRDILAEYPHDPVTRELIARLSSGSTAARIAGQAAK